MNKKGGPVIRSVEAIYKCAMDRKFRNRIREERLKLGIPRNGYGDEKEEMEQPVYMRSGLVLPTAINLLEEFGLTPACYVPMVHYLQFGNFNVDPEIENETLIIEYPDKSKKLRVRESLRKLKQPFVGFYILDGSNANSIVKYVRSHWPDIKQSIAAQGGDTSRIKTSPEKMRNHLISLLLEKNREDLYDMLGSSQKFAYKESLVAEVMRSVFDYQEVTPAIVKKYSAVPKRHIPTDKLKTKGKYRKKK